MPSAVRRERPSARTDTAWDQLLDDADCDGTSEDAMSWRQRRKQLTVSRHAAEEDVTTFGEDLQRLDSHVAGHALDEAMQQDYRRALDAYDDSKTSLAAVRKPDEIRHVTEILEDGRYAIATVKARIAGEPLPQRRSPCFFNPAHGPSVRDVDWAPPGGVTRATPACAADADRVLAGIDPSVRTVLVRSQRVPYWEGGPAYRPWAQGYYDRWGGSDLLTGILIGSSLGGFGGFDDFGGLDGASGVVGHQEDDLPADPGFFE
jgi:hypothetical protein